MALNDLDQARVAGRGEHPATSTALGQGGAGPALPSSPAPKGACDEVGGVRVIRVEPVDTDAKVVRIAGDNDDSTMVRATSDLSADMRLAFLRELEKELESHPEIARIFWVELGEFFAQKIKEYNKKIETLSRLLEIVRELAGDPETSWTGRCFGAIPGPNALARGRSLSPLPGCPSRGREWK
jgi:hypothetical protein